jgi:hypothetical protein
LKLQGAFWWSQSISETQRDKVYNPAGECLNKGQLPPSDIKNCCDRQFSNPHKQFAICRDHFPFHATRGAGTGEPKLIEELAKESWK